MKSLFWLRFYRSLLLRVPLTITIMAWRRIDRRQAIIRTKSWPDSLTPACGTGGWGDWCLGGWVNTLRPRQNGRHFEDDSFKWIFLTENVCMSIKISLKFVPRGPINNIPTLVQVMAWRRPGDKPLSGPIIVRLPTHICVTRLQWVNVYQNY